ncbi:hypothetical protein LN565_03085 [Xanthomonas euvesicatoria pv. euvesicatoria]|nr:hypothetical protein [Xanthomonas euvesicatoria]MCC8501450.1 hypothetical protein [Xanthomonas euvesicatoria pv. euvesicatoria]MCC8514495.1 hypothetical protein [Xanthomonas euvesicatoria pv. euvesicatoria]MCC8539984.1 hypothetical protein [Xanthomonas euvesicatoria pv. euvesicatoria]MCC8547916.1 hypothetical protein [Xanthomonas euvesicatoria pv. euvesicatoria]MCC8571509.1 hypothetical protein [Xanthomonas euvesicatoria pv. euvesicatoria]
MTNSPDDRRHRLLKATATFALLAASPLAICSGQPEYPTPQQQVASESRLLEIRVRGDLSGRDVALQLAPGELSPGFKLPDRRTYRVKASMIRTDPRFGPIYALVLADVSGNPLNQMNIASNTTATFGKQRVQVYLLSLEQAKRVQRASQAQGHDR